MEVNIFGNVQFEGFILRPWDFQSQKIFESCFGPLHGLRFAEFQSARGGEIEEKETAEILLGGLKLSVADLCRTR